MVRFHTKSGLAVMLLALGFLALSASPAQAALRDNRLGVFVDFPGKGATVVGFIPGSPAARAGVVYGDVIVAVEGHHVNKPEQYTNRVGRAGAIVKIHVKRGKKDLHFKIGN